MSGCVCVYMCVPDCVFVCGRETPCPVLCVSMCVIMWVTVCPHEGSVLVRTCVCCLPPPALLLVYLESLIKKKKKPRPSAQSPAAPSWLWRWSEEEAGALEEPWGGCRAASVGRPESCHWSPLFPLGRSSPIFPTSVASLSSLPSIKKAPRVRKNLMQNHTEK